MSKNFIIILAILVILLATGCAEALTQCPVLSGVTAIDDDISDTLVVCGYGVPDLTCVDFFGWLTVDNALLEDFGIDFPAEVVTICAYQKILLNQQ